MSKPVLLCQGFQKAFIDGASPFFSVSASMRRGTCEQILSHARNAGWTVIHVFLASRAIAEANSASMDGFSPRPTEAFFRQSTYSAFEAPGFAAKLDTLGVAPIFFMSLGGLSIIAATFLGGLSRRLPFCLISDAVADFVQHDVTEEEGLAAIETLARASGAWISTSELVECEPARLQTACPR